MNILSYFNRWLTLEEEARFIQDPHRRIFLLGSLATLAVCSVPRWAQADPAIGSYILSVEYICPPSLPPRLLDMLTERIKREVNALSGLTSRDQKKVSTWL